MGAIDQTSTFEAKNETEALKAAREIMDDARYEFGHDSYGGHLGCCDGVELYRTALPITEAKAEGIIFGDRTQRPRARKWGPAILIRIRNTGSRKAKWIIGGICPS